MEEMIHKAKNGRYYTKDDNGNVRFVKKEVYDEWSKKRMSVTEVVEEVVKIPKTLLQRIMFWRQE